MSLRISASGSYNVFASENAKPDRVFDKTVSCFVRFLDDTEHQFNIEVRVFLETQNFFVRMNS